VQPFFVELNLPLIENTTTHICSLTWASSSIDVVRSSQINSGGPCLSPNSARKQKKPSDMDGFVFAP
jgi:hypothetical protein